MHSSEILVYCQNDLQINLIFNLFLTPLVLWIFLSFFSKLLNVFLGEKWNLPINGARLSVDMNSCAVTHHYSIKNSWIHTYFPVQIKITGNLLSKTIPFSVKRWGEWVSSGSPPSKTRSKSKLTLFPLCCKLNFRSILEVWGGCRPFTSQALGEWWVALSSVAFGWKSFGLGCLWTRPKPSLCLLKSGEELVCGSRLCPFPPPP